MKDFLDKEVKVGDTIVYATRRSSYMDLHKAEVVELYEHGFKVKRDLALEPYRFKGQKEYSILTSPTFVIIG